MGSLRVLVLGLSLLMLLFTIACDSADDAPAARVRSGETATPTAIARPPFDPAAALLALADLPTGWMVASTGPSTETARALCGTALFPAPARAHAGAAFTRGPGTGVWLEVYEMPAGTAIETLAAARTRLMSCATWTPTAAEGRGLAYHYSALSFPRLGEETVALRMRVTGGVPLEADVLYIRRGDVLLLVTVYAPTVDSSLTEQLARLADAKLAATLP